MKLCGLIVAAGMSSRMQDFKPLLPLDGQPLLVSTVNSLKHSGITDIVVVLGRRAEALKALLDPLDVEIIVNEHYQSTAMFDSIRLGLTCLTDYDGIFFLPADVPLVSVYTIEALTRACSAHPEMAVFYPCYHGDRGHPPLVMRQAVARIIEDSGEQGLRGVLTQFEAQALNVVVPDRGCLLDADYPADYYNLQQYQETRHRPDRTTCLALLAWAQTSAKVQAHSEMVAEVALALGRALKQVGYPLDLARIESGALLHDILRIKAHHAQAGGELLAKLGYQETAEVVRAHMDLPVEALEALDERAVVFLADKLVRETQRVTIAERFANALTKHPAGTEAGDQVRQRMRMAQLVANKVNEQLHDGVKQP